MTLRSNVILLVLLTICLAGRTFAQDDPAAQAAELMKPGPEHTLLETLVGSWNMELKFWPSPGAEVVTASGTATHRMILGGRFLLMESTSGEGDLYAESMTIMGYDRRQHKFTNVGYDTWGTYYITAAGTYDTENRKFTLLGEDDDPVFGLKQKYSFITTIRDHDTVMTELVFHEFPMADGKDYTMVEISYRRK